MSPKSGAAIAAARTTRQPEPAPKMYLSIAEVAEQTGLSAKTIRRRIADGSLPARRIGSRVRIHRDDLAAFGRPIPSAAI